MLRMSYKGDSFYYQSKEKQAKYLIMKKGDGCPAYCKNCIMSGYHVCGTNLNELEKQQNKVMIAKKYLREQKLERICK